MRYFKRIVILFLATSLFPGVLAHAQDYPEVMFILDASGSMSEDAGGKCKMDAAKEVMTEIVPALEPEVRVGLTAYGHRRKGCCSDIEVVIPPGSTDRDALLARVKSMEPKGKTPISSAMLTVAGLLKTKENETTIVLVSDGIETCGGRPGQVAKQLKATGCKIVIHVVGFDVGAAAAKQLKGIATATGGKYFAADDAGSLLEALRTVSVEVTKKVEEAKTSTVHASTGLGKLRITMPEGSEKSLAAIHITRVKDNKTVKRVESPQAASTHPLLSGTYAIVCAFAIPNYGEPTLTEIGEVTISKGETRELQLGSISFNIPQHLVDNDLGSRLNVGEVILADAGTNEPVVTVLANNNGSYNFVSKPVVAGMYNVLFRYWTNTKSPTLVARNVQVNPGEDTLVALNSGIQFKKADSGLTGWDLMPKGLETPSADEDGSAAPVTAPLLEVRAFSPISGGNTCLRCPYLVPPGRYDIVIHVNGMDEPLPVAEDVDIKPGQFLQFDAGL